MMILPLADALQNCLQDLTSRIAGIDNEQMTTRAMGMGAMLGYGLGAIKEQFNSPNSNTTNKTNNTNTTNTTSGFSGFVNRAKSIINPNLNLSAEKDYNGNTNPIRDVIQTKTNNIVNPTAPATSTTQTTTNNKENVKSSKTTVAKQIVKGAYAGTKAYVSMGAKMTEGDFSSNSYRPTHKHKKNNFQHTEYIKNVSNNNSMQKLGDDNEFKENNK